MRVILDSNVWVSYLIGKYLATLGQILSSEKITVIFCPQIIEEVEEVCTRPKLKRLVQPETVRDFLRLVGTVGECVHVVSTVEACRDKDDDFLLGLAKDADADFLATGDEDLLVLKRTGKTKIIFLRKSGEHTQRPY